MKLMVFILACLPFFSHGQVKKANKADTIRQQYSKMLLGKWQSEDNIDWVIQFDKINEYTSLEGKDTSNTLHYLYQISPTCNWGDSAKRLSPNGNIYIILFDVEDSVFMCDLILGLNKKNFSYVFTSNGKPFLFKRKK
jgi:hypothetical protein